ncbi:uncharacterized protein I206_100680 [Kwoniella pini CBS 10737]|uniref:FAS1 domain-containing protein n=1 Tax=Kwoniella pini CBS 10737 TaxID=1296096 RepID=A0A1B9ICX8_9TREE|nr:uncharacterized protein I206_00645 [Kwoniella pini CBS 10737]OCF53343.1 hypothetical protein I206_00645 [Kwoniella pini CBS 10737]
MIKTLSLFSLLLAVSVLARPPNATVYFNGLEASLIDNGLSGLWNAIAVANSTETGPDLINKLYSDNKFTIYAPNNAAWQGSGLSQPPANGDLASLLSYHIVQATLNSSTDIAPIRHHTIAFTELRSPTVDLPGDQTQVIVLETAVNATTGQEVNDGSVLIRGDNWNATSSGDQFTYENLFIQPMDKILTVPSPFLKTLSQSGLAITANLGATSAISAISSSGLNNTLSQNCHGCTFFIPVNKAFESAAQSTNITSLDDSSRSNVILNHVLNGSVVYSPDLNSGNAYITSAGMPLIFLIDEQGKKFISVGQYRASIVRSDIPISNGVVHLIDTLMVVPQNNHQRADDAASSAASAAVSRTTTTNVIGVGGTSPTTTSTATTSSATGSRTQSSAFSNKQIDLGSTIKVSIISVILGGLWV